MGTGVNTFIGFGEQTVEGGGDRRSKVLLNFGTYVLSPQADGFLVTLVGDTTEAAMDVFGFGMIGNAINPSNALPIRAGTLSIHLNGSAS